MVPFCVHIVTWSPKRMHVNRGCPAVFEPPSLGREVRENGEPRREDDSSFSVDNLQVSQP